MSDTKAILDAVFQLRRAAEPFLVATVARVRGSSYRRPGARMLLTRDRWIAGSVSGGCLEGDVVRKGWWRTRDGAPVIVTYDATVEDDVEWGFGLGCDGVVNVLLEREGDSGRLDPFGFLASCVAGQKRGVLATVLGDVEGRLVMGARVGLRADGGIESDVVDGEARSRVELECCKALAAGETRVTTCVIDGVSVEVLLEAVLPPPRVFILGARHDAVPVAGFARTLGWEVIICEPHARLSTRERFTAADAVLIGDEGAVAARVDASDRAAAIVMGHDYERDRASLKMLVGTRARYIGVLGPRRRALRMVAELGLAENDPRVHAPVGLELGAETPEEIALAIVAEVQSVLTGAGAASLRGRRGTIHGPPRIDAAEQWGT